MAKTVEGYGVYCKSDKMVDPLDDELAWAEFFDRLDTARARKAELEESTTDDFHVRHVTLLIGEPIE